LMCHHTRLEIAATLLALVVLLDGLLMSTPVWAPTTVPIGENASAPDSSPSVFNPLAQNASNVRLIAHTTSASDRALFKSKGCVVTHELRDATSLTCPGNVSIPNSSPDTVLYVLDTTSDKQIKADQVWPSYDGTGVTVAVLDTGIDYNHLQLKSSSGSSDPSNGHCFAVTAGDCGNGFLDDYGHGTHVSGIITSDGIADANNGAFSKGVAPGARIWMAKVCNGSGSCYTSDMAAAIQYVVTNHIAKVMSISIGGGGTTSSNCDTDYLAQQINWAYDNGVVAAIAAGNSGTPSVSSPGCASKAIAVAAVDSSNNLASFSSYGNALKDHGVAAPGVSIYSTVPTITCALCSSTGYLYASGTSMATPHVSATIALMLQKNPNLAPADIRSTIFNTADCLSNKYGACPNIYIGWGRIDALNAVNPSSTTFLTVSANPSSITTTQTSTITASTSNVASSVQISFTTTLGTLSPSPSCQTGANGQCSVTLSSANAGSATVSASASGYTPGSTSVTITQAALSLSANPTSITTSQMSTITASTNDGKSGVVISLSTNLGSLSSNTCTTSSGVCSVTFSSTSAGTATITATATGYTSAKTTVTVSSATPSLSVSVKTNKGSYTRGSSVTVTVTVTSSSVRVNGATVTGTIVAPNGVITNFSGSTNSKGVYSYTYTSTQTSGTYIVSATATHTGYSPGSGSTTFKVR
jgi:minor extracellular protease Epr